MKGAFPIAAVGILLLVFLFIISGSEIIIPGSIASPMVRTTDCYGDAVGYWEIEHFSKAMGDSYDGWKQRQLIYSSFLKLGDTNDYFMICSDAKYTDNDGVPYRKYLEGYDYVYYPGDTGAYNLEDHGMITTDAECYTFTPSQIISAYVSGAGLDVQFSSVCTPIEPDETCYDNIQNQGETGIDCGGPCAACEEPPPQTYFDLIIQYINNIITEVLSWLGL